VAAGGGRRLPGAPPGRQPLTDASCAAPGAQQSDHHNTSVIPFSGTAHPARAAADDDHFGFLKLVLRSDGWTQSFKRTDGSSYDAKRMTCNQ
jgi:hypothetical protein